MAKRGRARRPRCRQPVSVVAAGRRGVRCGPSTATHPALRKRSFDADVRDRLRPARRRRAADHCRDLPAACRAPEAAATRPPGRGGNRPGIAAGRLVPSRLVRPGRRLPRHLRQPADRLGDLHLRVPAPPGVRGRPRRRRAGHDRGCGAHPAARHRRHPGDDSDDRLRPVAARERAARRLPAAGCRRRHHRSRRGDRHLSRCRRAGAPDPPGRRRGASQRRGGDCAVRRAVRHDRERTPAGHRARGWANSACPSSAAAWSGCWPAGPCSA